MDCKFCGGEIEDGAKKCKHCKEWLNKGKNLISVKLLAIMISLLLVAVGLLVLLNNSEVMHFFSDAPTLQYNPKEKAYEYVDKKGNIVVSLNKDITLARGFSEGLAVVQSNSKMGAIDKTGMYVINPVYDYLWDSSEGLIPYWNSQEDGNTYLGYLDKKGNIAIQPKPCKGKDEIIWYNPSFINGLAVAYDSVSGKYGFINKKGEFAIKPTFDYADAFSEGLAPVLVNKKYGYIDKNGKFIINLQFDYAERFSEGMAVVATMTESPDGAVFSNGYINKDGKIVISTKYEDAKRFSEGLAAVYKNKRWGYIDKTGKYVLKPSYKGLSFGWANDYYEDSRNGDLLNYAFPIINGVVPVCSKWDNNEFYGCKAYALVDKIGQVQGDKYFDDISRLTKDTYIVKIKEQEGVINSKGDWIIPIKMPEKRIKKTVKKIIKIPTQNTQTNVKTEKKTERPTKKVTQKKKKASSAINDLRSAEQDLLN